MERHLKAHLFDKVPKRFDEYQKNLMLRRAVERNIGIIGEATNKIDKEYPDIQISNVRAIVATRNRVIHDYAAVTDDVIWKIVINDLPKLKTRIAFWNRETGKFTWVYSNRPPLTPKGAKVYGGSNPLPRFVKNGEYVVTTAYNDNGTSDIFVTPVRQMIEMTR